MLTNNYVNITANIYLTAGNHYFFQCDSEVYTPKTADGTGDFYDYCANMIGSTNTLSQYYFKRDNYTVNIMALTCDYANNLGIIAGGYCVSGTTKPTLYI